MTRQLLVTFLLAAAARAQTPPPQAAPAPAGPAPSAVAAEVFRRFADGVVKIQVVETGSAAKAELGSGFFVTPRGHVVTNYHVVSKVVQHPERYRGEMLDRAGGTRPVRVLAVDVIHDVAVLATDATPALSFTLGAVRPSQGDRLYSLGHPHDLGLSIVEGTYNGLLQHTLYPKIHFTGAINPGMSGGPTLTERGQVVGINVRTAALVIASGLQVFGVEPVEEMR